MKKLIKAATAAISGILMITSAFVSAGAATVPCGNTDDILSLVKQQCGQGNVQVLTNFSGCADGDVQSVVDKLCRADGNCFDIQSILNYGGCVGPDCEQEADPAQPAAPETVPVTEPAQPVVTDTVPSAEPKETTPANTSDFNKAFEDEVIRLVNVERAKYGLPALDKREDATQAAEIRAKEIVTSFSHTRPDGSSCFTAAKEVGMTYRSAGENIAYGYSSPQSVVTGWMNSEGHRKNILSSSFSGIGVGCYNSNGVLYWSQFFVG